MGKITFLLGGARSGKSGYAVELGREYKASEVVFIATAQAFDNEMRLRISAHQQARPSDWRIIEEPNDIAAAIKRAPLCKMIIIDCITVYVSNLLLSGQNAAQIMNNIAFFLSLLREKSADAVIISNETGSGVVPANDLARKYRDILGEVNKVIAAQSDCVYWFVAGLKQKLKGECDA